MDIISNILLVKLFSRQKDEDKRFAKTLIKASRAEQIASWEAVLLWRGQHVITGTFITLTLLICVYGYKGGIYDIADVGTAITLAIAFGKGFWYLLQTMAGFFSKLAEIQEALDTIVTPVEISDVKDAKDISIKEPSIDFKNVTFSYPNCSVLNDLSLSIPANQKIGLIGPSGAGKTTCVQLLLRLFDIQKGSIEFDGNDISKVTQDSVRQSISFIPQTTDLLHRSVLDNIKYGDPDASMDKVIEAAKKSHIHDVIIGLEDHLGNKGYETIVGERGVKLSGGQRQRIAIARAILKDAPILILDEATSALDSESESLIQKSLQNLMEGKTVIAIAHRLSTINQLDRLIVMDNGKIIEDGSHGELLDKKGLYAKLWDMQSGGFLKEE